MVTPLSNAQRRALGQLVDLWGMERFALIGATALSLQSARGPRETLDVDIVVACTMEAYPAGLETLPGWRRHPKREHEWEAPDAVRIDVLPIATGAAETLRWPSAFEMSSVGLELCLPHSTEIDLGGGVRVRVALVPVIIFLKMVAFQDRPHERRRDLEDIAYALHTYVDPAADRFFDEMIVERGIDVELVPAWLLGHDVGESVHPNHDEKIRGFMRFLDDEQWADRMAREGPRSWNADAVEVKRRLDAFAEGYAVALSRR